MPKRKTRELTEPAPVQLYCKTVATRRATAAARQKFEEAANGGSDLHEELWLKVFGFLSMKEVAQSVSGVCRQWREWGYIASGTELRACLIQKCPQCHDVERRPLGSYGHCSLLSYIRKRHSTLKVVRITDNGWLGIYMFQSLLTALSECKNLEHVEIYISSTHLPTYEVEPWAHLPSSVRIFRSNQMYFAHSSFFPALEEADLTLSVESGCAVFKVLQSQSLRKLTLRNVPPFLPLQNIGLSRLTELTIQPAQSIDHGLMELLMAIPNLEKFLLRHGLQMKADFSVLKDHPSLKEVRVVATECTNQTLATLYALPQTVLVDASCNHTAEELVLSADLSQSKLEALSVASALEYALDLPRLLKAPKLHTVDMWGVSGGLNLDRSNCLDLIPKERPLRIRLDSDEGFTAEDSHCLTLMGFNVVHETPPCHCCGRELSLWHAEYDSRGSFEQLDYSSSICGTPSGHSMMHPSPFLSQSPSWMEELEAEIVSSSDACYRCRIPAHI